MRPIYTQHQGQEKTLACEHFRTWPPAEVVLDKTGIELRQSGRLSEVEFQRYQVWENHCGLEQMAEAKCLQCPHARFYEERDHLPVLVTLDGTKFVPITDATTLETAPHARGNMEVAARPPGSVGSGQDAEWTQQQQRKQDG